MESIRKEQKFFSVLKDLFVGAKLEGKSGYVNLMNIKTDYFDKIEIKLREEIKKLFEWDEKEILFDHLNTFFESYFSDGGAIFFSSTPVYKNIYAKIYSDREDTALFWKTANLYYIKSEPNYKSVNGLTLKDDGEFKFDFDASAIEHKKANEKKELQFLFVGFEKNSKTLKFKVRYKNNNKYEKLKNILKLKSSDEVKKYLQDNYLNIKNKNISVIINELNFDKLNFKSKTKDTIKAEFSFTEKEQELFNIIEIEPVITEVEQIEKYLKIIAGEYIESELIKKAFRIYKKQTEIDYFIHKNGESFLKEQFKLFIYQYLSEDFETIFDEKRLDLLRRIKQTAYKTIEYIAKFEEELKKIWLKPKFVLDSNYVITFDRISEKDRKLEIIKKILNNNGIKQQIEEWQELGMVNKDFDKDDIITNNLNGEHLNNKYQHLPIDTEYFKDLEIEILKLFDNLDDALNGWLIKSDNFQALNTILPKFKEKVQTIYIDPPFNTGDDFDYVDKFQDSTWLTLMENRLELAREF